MKTMIFKTLVVFVGAFVLGGLGAVPADAVEIVLYQSTYVKGKEKPRKNKMQDEFNVPPFVEKLRVFLRASEGSKGNAATVFIGGNMVSFSEEGEAEVALGRGRIETMKEQARATREGKKTSNNPDRKMVEVTVHGKDGTSVNLVVVGVVNPSSLPR